jgi:hypothetical protein
MRPKRAVWIVGSILAFSILAPHQGVRAQRHPPGSGAPRTYYPLAPGSMWTYRASGSAASSGVEGSGRATISNLAARELDGKSATLQRLGMQFGALRQFSGYGLVYVAEDQSGVYKLAEQRSVGAEPKIGRTPDYILKEPVKVGNSWPASVDSPLGYSAPGEATIESTDETVDVPAGGFEHCVRVHTVGISKGSMGEESYKWFAPSVGLVKLVLKWPGLSVSFLLVSLTTRSQPPKPLAGEPSSAQPILPSSMRPRAAIAQPQPNRAAALAATKRFYVRHRDRGTPPGAGFGIVTSYSEGWLLVTPNGTVAYACTTADPIFHRCERGWFPPIKDVELYEGGLRITLVQGGNWDFFGTQSEIRSAYAAILPYTEEGRKRAR